MEQKEIHEMENHGGGAAGGIDNGGGDDRKIWLVAAIFAALFVLIAYLSTLI